MDTSYCDETVRVGSKRKEKMVKKMKEGVYGTKEFQAYCKTHSTDQAEEFLAKDSEELKKIISYCTVEIKEEKEEVEDTPEYQKAKEDLKVFNDSLNEAIKPLKHTIELATLLLRDRGQHGLEGAIKDLQSLGGTMEVKLFGEVGK
jgi:hypothetical protein